MDKSAFELSKGFAPDTIRSRDNYRRRGHGLTTGQVVYFDGTESEWKLSDWLYLNLTGSSEAVGIIDVKDPYRFDVVYRGSISLPTTTAVTGPVGTVAENTVYFVSDTPGILTATPPTIDLQEPKVRKPILVTLGTNSSGNIDALVVNYRGYVEDTEGCVAFVQNIIPVGTIEIVPGGLPQPTDLEGWLLCDGSSYPISEYPDLYRVIGYSYGIGTSGTSTFKVPDFSAQRNIMLGAGNGFAYPQSPTGGDADIQVLPSDVADVGAWAGGIPGYASISANKNRQAAYQANFYIRYKAVERYVNIETCNNAGGAIRNWIVNGSFDVWQRGIDFAPQQLTGSDQLADLNRYTADRWFRKVGYCPDPFGATGTGEDSPSSYIGVCKRKSFAQIDASLPDILLKQFPSHYMEYQSFISGPGADTSLEYCVLENRIGDVKSLSGETVCLSFWARSGLSRNSTVYLNLKQHFGYDVPELTPRNLLRSAATGSSEVTWYTGETSVTPLGIADINSKIEELSYPAISGSLFIGAPDVARPYVGWHHGYEGVSGGVTTESFSADASSKGSVGAISDFINAPDTKQVAEVLGKSITYISNAEVIGLPVVSAPPGKYTVVANVADEGAIEILSPEVFLKNTQTSNTKVESFRAVAADIVVAGTTVVNSESNPSVSVIVTVDCVPSPYCTSCASRIRTIQVAGSDIYSASPIDPCEATQTSIGVYAVQPGSTSNTVKVAVPLIPTHFTLFEQYTNGSVSTLNSEVISAIYNHVASDLLENPACRCEEVSFRLGIPTESCNGMTVPQNYDPTNTLGICCTITVGSTTVGESGAFYVTHTRTENSTVHDCATAGGQFIPYSALEYFGQFETTQCGVTEDQCSEFVAIQLTPEWKQYEVVFRVPSVNNRYIGNSGTDYLALQLWTHLSNGYCRAYSQAEIPPRDRLGEDFGTVECTENSLCEPCVSVFPFSFSNTDILHLAQFQLQTGSEFTGFVKPDKVELLEQCQAFYETNPCVGRGEFAGITGGGYVYDASFKREKVCKQPRAIISSFRTGNTGFSGIDIDATSVTAKGFTVNINSVDANAAYLAFTYDCDCDIYRPEELQYLNRQLEWDSV